MTLKAIIFDVDGTIAETERDGHRVAFNLTFQEVGLNWQWDVDFYGDLLEIGGGKERLRYYINHFQSNFKPEIPLDEFIVHLHKIKTRYYRQLLQNNNIALRPGIKRLMTEAKQAGILLAIASTAALPNVISLIETSLSKEALSWFKVIAAGDMVKQKKPAPDIYLLALEKLELKPHECLVIEDTNQGLKAAIAAGLKTVITVNEYTKNQNFEEAVLVLNHLGEEELPFKVIKGDAKNQKYFNLELAQWLLKELT